MNTVSFSLQVIDEGLSNRRTAETRMNTESSRSHAILTLMVKTTVTHGGGIAINKRSRLNLVDLAGSERQKDSKSDGERLKVRNSFGYAIIFVFAFLSFMIQNLRL